MVGADQQEAQSAGGRIYAGTGQVVTVADTGFDIGSNDRKVMHPAFSKTKVSLLAVASARQVNDPNGHGTHVAASVVDTGTSSALGPDDPTTTQGTAPGASLVLQSLLTTSLGFEPPEKLYEDLFQPPYSDHESRIHTNSWGSVWNPKQGQREYEDYAADVDRFVWDNPDFIVVVAAGNDNERLDSNGNPVSAQIGGIAAAKNCITVGASESSRKSDGMKYQPERAFANDTFAVARFSSMGPTAEMRPKPDVVAPGSAILSAKSQDIRVAPDRFAGCGVSTDSKWAFASGTSMATPLVAGCAALVREALVATDSTDGRSPSAALVKALLIHYATEMSGAHEVATPKGGRRELYSSPRSHSYGFGRVNVEAVLLAIEDRSRLGTMNTYKGFDDSKPALKFGATAHFHVAAPPGVAANPSLGSQQTPKLKVTLVYSDREGAGIRNHLCLRVQGTGRDGDTYRKEYEGPENNVQQVVWDDPLAKGADISVEATTTDQVGDSQPFAIVWDWC